MKIEKIWKGFDNKTYITATIQVGERVTDEDAEKVLIEFIGKRRVDEYIKEEKLNILNKNFNMKQKVIFNNPATIYINGDKKYISKAHDEPFDEEKGLLMCLAKAQGISHLELKRMIKGAKREYKPLPPKERKSINGVSIKQRGGIVDPEIIEKTIENGPSAICVPVSIHDEFHSNIEFKKYLDSKIKKALKKRGRPKKNKG